MARFTVNKLVGCKLHRTNDHPSCLSCQVAIDWNVYGHFCMECMEPAAGYVMRSLEDVSFYCDSHWRPLAVRA